MSKLSAKRFNIYSVAFTSMVFICAAVSLLIYADLWSIFAVPAASIPFLDMTGVLGAAECHAQGIVVVENNPCDPLGRKHIYGLPLLWLGELGITRAHVSGFGWALALLFCVVVTLRVKPRTFLQVLCLVLILFSPAVLLGVERGNYDLLLASLSIGAAYSFAHSSRLGITVGLMLVLWCTLTKFYPGSVLGMLFVYFTLRKHLFGVLASAASLLIVLAYVWANQQALKIIFADIPRSSGSFTFGGETIFPRLGLELTTQTMLLTLVVGMAITMAAFFPGRKLGARLAQTHLLSRITFLIGATQLMFCFYTSISYDYRAVFSLLLLPLFFEYFAIASKREKALLGVGMLSYIYTLWAEFFVAWAEPFIAHPWFRVSESLLMWILSIAVMVLLWATLLAGSDFNKDRSA